MELPLASSKASFRGVANAWGLQLMICMIWKGSPILHRGVYYCEGFYNCGGSPWGFIIAMVWSCSGACCLQISIGSIEICRRCAAAGGGLGPTGLIIRSCSSKVTAARKQTVRHASKLSSTQGNGTACKQTVQRARKQDDAQANGTGFWHPVLHDVGTWMFIFSSIFGPFWSSLAPFLHIFGTCMVWGFQDHFLDHSRVKKSPFWDPF